MYTYDMSSTVMGTECYLSPKYIKDRAWGFSSDIWALGCVVLEMMTGMTVLNMDLSEIPELPDRSSLRDGEMEEDDEDEEVINREKIIQNFAAEIIIFFSGFNFFFIIIVVEIDNETTDDWGAYENPIEGFR
ncbi:Protein kinase domain [Dillenia turbinata]|uniref:non-specific serine/threonine protein kinase n=1 Tax=Dillenia turbinata TaxID=194707 RepID=A0AAN8VIG0_9MAGN